MEGQLSLFALWREVEWQHSEPLQPQVPLATVAQQQLPLLACHRHPCSCSLDHGGLEQGGAAAIAYFVLAQVAGEQVMAAAVVSAAKWPPEWLQWATLFQGWTWEVVARWVQPPVFGRADSGWTVQGFCGVDHAY